jgi:hypothetical protein
MSVRTLLTAEAPFSRNLIAGRSIVSTSMTGVRCCRVLDETGLLKARRLVDKISPPKSFWLPRYRWAAIGALAAHHTYRYRTAQKILDNLDNPSITALGIVPFTQLTPGPTSTIPPQDSIQPGLVTLPIQSWW